MTLGFFVIAQSFSLGGSTVCVFVAEPHCPSIFSSFFAEHCVFFVYCEEQVRVRLFHCGITDH